MKIKDFTSEELDDFKVFVEEGHARHYGDIPDEAKLGEYGKDKFGGVYTEHHLTEQVGSMLHHTTYIHGWGLEDNGMWAVESDAIEDDAEETPYDTPEMDTYPYDYDGYGFASFEDY